MGRFREQMMALSRVVWSEGMHLAQHHFQAQNRYFEDSMSFALSHLFYKSYGVAGLELDGDALRNGTVSLIHGRGVMPDGLAFHIPDGDPLPPTREIRDLFSPTQDSHLVLLTIPPYRPDQSNCAMPPDGGRKDVRYLAEPNRVADETTGRDEKAVDVGRKNFRLMLDVESTDDLISLPLARVRRDGTGHFIYDEEYIPPCLQIGASPRLMELLRRLIDMLESKSDALARERSSDSKALAEYAAHEVANFWLSHAIHSSLAPLRHNLEVRRTRPEQLYMEMARLAGALCTFSLDSHPRNLPLYDHDHLHECFTALDRHIRAHLGVTIPTNFLSIPLKREREYLHIAKVKDKRSFGKTEWILGVRSNLPDAEVIIGVPKLVKVCSEKHIIRLVKEAYSGLALDHLSPAPSAVSPRIGSQYFRITKSGPCWESIHKAKDIGIYAPSSLAEAEFELLIVLEGQE
jgi:type VI secretion system protein ImpJ